jgi:SAM-dependent methyltransferase
MATQAEWTPDKIRDFWNYYGQRIDLHDEYFSYQVGKGIVTFLGISGKMVPGMKLLDLGCGPGFLLQELLSCPYECWGFDYSDQTVKLVNEKFQSFKNWRGAIASDTIPVPFPDGNFDLVACVETLEHLQDDVLFEYLKEVQRLLNINGFALFTVPYEEDLSRNRTYCPFCDTEFHKVQHLRSFTAQSLSALMESHGFRVIYCDRLDFRAFQMRMPSWGNINMVSLWGWSKIAAVKAISAIFPRSFQNGKLLRLFSGRGPHLCALVAL